MGEIELVLGDPGPADQGAAAPAGEPGGDTAKAGGAPAKPEAPAGTPAVDGEPAKHDRRYEALQQQVERLTRQNETLSAEIMQALRHRDTAEPTAPARQADPEIAGDAVIDTLARDGTRAFARLGLVTEAQARRMADEAVAAALSTRVPEVIQQHIGAATREAEKNASIVRQFNWIGNASDERNATFEEYFRTLQTEDPDGAKNPDVRRYMLRSAAAAAQADHERKGAQDTERTRRIDRQAPRGSGGADGAPAEPVLSAEARQLAVGLGLDPEAIGRRGR